MSILTCCLARLQLARSDIPLPEISSASQQEYERSWTRFTFVAVAKEWDKEKQLKVIPTLLCGQLLDDYVSLSAEERPDVKTLKSNLGKRAGLRKDFVTATRQFRSRKQRQGERENRYLTDLKRLYNEAFPEESGKCFFVFLQKCF